MENLLKTPLLENHIQLKAQMAPFGGWMMPIQYAGIIAEHKQCRESVSLFDICHMGEFYYKGDIKTDGLEKALSLPVERIPIGKCKYGLLLNDAGGINDDLIVYRLAENELMIVVNAGTIQSDFKTIQSQLSSACHFENISGFTAKLDIQGPLSRDVMVQFFGTIINSIPYFGFKNMDILGEPAIVSRTGYTGELGYEIYINQRKVEELWNLLLTDSRVKPAGLGARDILRLEVGYCLYGNDINSETTPGEAGLENFIDFNKDFTGKPALLKKRAEGIKKTRIAFQASNRRSPRQHYRILHNGIDCGEVTSGCFSPILGRGIGMGYVTPDISKPGTPITLTHESIEIDAVITEMPFYKGGSLRK